MSIPKPNRRPHKTRRLAPTPSAELTTQPSSPSTDGREGAPPRRYTYMTEAEQRPLDERLQSLLRQLADPLAADKLIPTLREIIDYAVSVKLIVHNHGRECRDADGNPIPAWQDCWETHQGV